jgi:hypothetical protein
MTASVTLADEVGRHVHRNTSRPESSDLSRSTAAASVHSDVISRVVEAGEAVARSCFC